MPQADMTWTRAALASILTFAALLLVFFYVPQWILSGLTAPARGIRIWLATAWVAGAFVTCCIVAWRSTAAREHSAGSRSDRLA